MTDKSGNSKASRVAAISRQKKRNSPEEKKSKKSATMSLNPSVSKKLLKSYDEGCTLLVADKGAQLKFAEDGTVFFVHKSGTVAKGKFSFIGDNFVKFRWAPVVFFDRSLSAWKLSDPIMNASNGNLWASFNFAEGSLTTGRCHMCWDESVTCALLLRKFAPDGFVLPSLLESNWFEYKAANGIERDEDESTTKCLKDKNLVSCSLKQSIAFARSHETEIRHPLEVVRLFAVSA